MNHCRDCNSDYEKPGTCNCFAPNGKRAMAVPYVPYVPGWVPPVTTAEPYDWRKYTITWVPAPVPYTTTTTWVNV